MNISRSTLASMRFGVGSRPGFPAPSDPDTLLAGLGAVAAANPIRGSARAEDMVARVEAFADARRAVRKGARQLEVLQQARRRLSRAVEREQAQTLARAAVTPHGFGERMARFWEGHFAVAIRHEFHAPQAAAFSDGAIRPHLTGRFADMLAAVAQSPGMLVYLDQQASAGPNSRAARRQGMGLNENLGREILELHTLGVDADYSQADVRAMSLLLTGFSVRRGGEQGFRYASWRAQPGRISLLGRSYEGGHREETLRALADLSVHPATARHLARKIVVHFVADRPPEALVAELERVWMETRGDLREVSAALLAHPDAWAGPLAKARLPQELVIAALRSAKAEPDEIGRRRLFRPELTFQAAADMSQPFLRPPGPNGWPEAAEDWITPAGVAARLEWATGFGAVLAARKLDPRNLAQAVLGDALHPETARAISVAPERREGFALLLASPDFNRR